MIPGPPRGERKLAATVILRALAMNQPADKPISAPISALEALERAQWIAFAPMVFQAACVLRDRGILAALEASRSGLTLEEAAQAAKLPIYGTRVLLEAGLGIGIVQEQGDRWQLTKVGTFLLRDPMTRANMDFTRDVNYLGMAHLGDAVATGKPAGLKVFGAWATVYEGLAELPEDIRRSWFGFDHFYSDGAFASTLPLVFKQRPRRLLDIGGNTGKWANACLRHDPDVEVTLMDLPGQLRNAEELLRGAGLLARVRFHPADLLDPETAIPPDFDAIWMSQFLDCFSEAEIVSILRRCAAAIPPHGRIYILEAFWDQQRFKAASFCLQMTSLYFTAIANGTSQMYRSTTFLACVEAAGLEVETQHHELGMSHTLLVCKPRA